MRVGLLAPLAAVAVASVIGYAALDGTDTPDRAVGSPAERSDASRASAGSSTLIAMLPEVGRLTSRCDLHGRSSTMLTLPLPGSSVDVSVKSDRRQVFKDRRLDPPASNKRHGRLPTPLERVSRQRWRIRYYHPQILLRPSSAFGSLAAVAESASSHEPSRTCERSIRARPNRPARASAPVENQHCRISGRAAYRWCWAMAVCRAASVSARRGPPSQR